MTGDQTTLTDTMKQSWIKPRIVLISVINIYTITTLQPPLKTLRGKSISKSFLFFSS